MASEDAKKDIAFVRKEKKEDDAIARRLEEVYGKAAAARDNGYRRSKKGWECPSCGYVNFESRLACGECLDVHPSVAEGTRFQRKSGPQRSGASDTASSVGGTTVSTGGTTATAVSSSARGQLLERLPNIKKTGESADPFATILQISDRCYRVPNFPSASVALGKKKAVRAYFSSAAQQQQRRGGEDDANDDGGSCGEGSEDGFGSCGSHSDDGEEVVCGGPGRAPFAGEALDDFGDDDDDDYDVYANTNKTAASSTAVSGVTIRACKDSDGEFEAKMYVSPLLYGFIIGKKGAALAETQRTTNTIIKVPKATANSTASSSSGGKKGGSAHYLPSADETIVIRGPDRASVTAAVVRIEAIVLENRARVGYTHFLSIPLGKDASLRATAGAVIEKMKAVLCDDTTSSATRIDTSLFQDPSWLHFTVLMLRLHTHAELELAKRLLQTEVRAAAEKLFSPSSSTSRKIELKGLNIMNDDASAADVLYIEPKPKDGLVALVGAINAIFTSAGLCLQHDTARNDKLHATLMNSKFRKPADASAEGTTTRQQRIPFDATPVLEGFGDARFGEYTVGRLELSRMNAPDEAHSSSRARASYYGCEDYVEF